MFWMFVMLQLRLMEYRITWDLSLLRMSIGNHSDCIDEGRSTAQSRWCHSLAGVLDRVEKENWAPPLSSCECHAVATSHSRHLDLPTMMDHVPEL